MGQGRPSSWFDWLGWTWLNLRAKKEPVGSGVLNFGPYPNDVQVVSSYDVKLHETGPVTLNFIICLNMNNFLTIQNQKTLPVKS
jgi:hypothetical protein